MGQYVDAYVARMRGCASRMSRELAEISDRNRAVRLVESDAASVESGFASGLLSVESVNRVRTVDPYQGTAWLVEGDPAHLCWEALPQLAAYVELIDGYRYPRAAVRFATPDSELELDLAVLDEDGRVLVLGEARAEPLLLTKLVALVPTYEGDPGWPRRGSSARDARTLAHRLWLTRAPYLWLVAAGARRAFRVSYGRTLTLTPVAGLPSAAELWPQGFRGATPRITLPPVAEAAAG